MNEAVNGKCRWYVLLFAIEQLKVQVKTTGMHHTTLQYQKKNPQWVPAKQVTRAKRE